MARYNTVVSSTSTSTASATIASPSSGAFTEFTSSTNAVTIGDPALFAGSAQTFFNNTAGTVTLTSGGSGQFIGGGPSSSTFSMATGTILTVISDGAYWVVNGPGIGPHAVTSLTASGAVTLNPASANVTISPTGTGQVVIAPATLGTIDNVNIGVTTRGTGAFTTLTANSTVTFSPAALVAISPTGGLTINPSSVAGTINNTSIGVTTQAAGSFTTLAASGLVTSTNTTQGASATSGQSALFGGGVGINGTLYTVGLVETSSIVFKENINPITGALAAILKLTGVTYDRKDNKKHEAGLIAEHVFKHVPELVALDEKGKPYGIHYTKISAYLIECIKTLQSEIDQLKGKKKTKGSK